MHPVRRRLLVEELVRRRSPDEERRYAASQRAGRIDPNPHQIDAVIFALARIPEGGAILADEVGLGKTIEAGLVIAQLRAEGAKKILLVTPKPLLGQWREELWSLFGLTVREVAQASSDAFEGEGLFAVGRELAGTKPIAGRIAKAGPWDLCVIDEAHEHFAAIYKRYDAAGFEREDSPHA
ncbi:MAG: SNF2-related protein, partial [Myxococcota bacterium]|nr:SNF2-related protein [Myxococcota bacterium]